MSFQKDFAWGAAAASYQIEGAAREDGKGLSVWDMFCLKEGAVWKGQTGDIACDHYHRYKEDVAIMKRIGLKAYRLSVSWPRVMPAGTGKVNRKGLDFYDKLVDELLRAGIKPFVTLFHWDYPLELYCRGSWLNRDSADWFAEYAKVVVSRLGDRVKHWMTFNEPQVFVGLGYHAGRHAPGDKLGFAKILRISHHVLLAHGKGILAIRASSRGKTSAGFAFVGEIAIPASGRKEDIKAARDWTFGLRGRSVWGNAWWMDPAIKGRYPAEGLRLYKNELPEIRTNDMKTICQPMDFLGFNHYQGPYVRRGADGKAEQLPWMQDEPLTAFKWRVTPDSLYWGPKFFWERYRLPIYVTENGMANGDWVSLDGKVHDPQRIDFLNRYLLNLRKAAGEGVPVKGYFVWSIMDNFEWAEGYKERFGMVFVDYKTQRRIPKDSAWWYKDVIESNGMSL